ncbi:MAG: DUF4332 domain-containing protein [Thiolinea sp.]
MISGISFVLGMLVAWGLEWLYVYFTRSAPQQREITQLRTELDQQVQSSSATEAARSQLEGEVTALRDKLTVLTAERDAAQTENTELYARLLATEQPLAVSTAENAAEAAVDETVLATEVTEDGEVQPEDEVVIAAADDLTVISGIGPKMAELLRQNGVSNYRQLAASNIDNLLHLLQEHGVPHSRARVVTWPEQAVYAADGDVQGLQAYLQGLKD